jgi:hypothetical protein
MLAEFGHPNADYADERFPIQTRSSLSDAYIVLQILNKNIQQRKTKQLQLAQEIWEKQEFHSEALLTITLHAKALL